MSKGLFIINLSSCLRENLISKCSLFLGCSDFFKDTFDNLIKDLKFSGFSCEIEYPENSKFCDFTFDGYFIKLFYHQSALDGSYKITFTPNEYTNSCIIFNLKKAEAVASV